MGFAYIMKAPLLPSCCGFFAFRCNFFFFFVVSSLFCFWFFYSCDFGVFMRGGELKSYSAILSLILERGTLRREPSIEEVSGKVSLRKWLLN